MGLFHGHVWYGFSAWVPFAALVCTAQVVRLAVVLVAVIGWLSAWNMSLNRGMLQMQVEPTMRGRIMSIDMMSHGLMALGVIPISYTADRYSVAIALEVAGVLFVLVVLALAAFTSSVRRVDENMENSARVNEG
jgi:hypothetical protein